MKTNKPVFLKKNGKLDKANRRMALTTKQRNYIQKNKDSKSAKELAGILKTDVSEVEQYLDSLKKESQLRDSFFSGRPLIGSP